MTLVVKSPIVVSIANANPPVSVPTEGGITSEQIAQAVEDYFTENPASGEPALAAHLIDPLPHEVYDEIPSLTLIFENGII